MHIQDAIDAIGLISYMIWFGNREILGFGFFNAEGSSLLARSLALIFSLKRFEEISWVLRFYETLSYEKIPDARI